MAEGVQYIVTLNDPSVISAFGRMEGAAVSFERSIAGINNTLAGLGIAFGVREIAEWGKQWVQGAADYEQAMLRIKNASPNLGEGIKNQLFIRDEVDKYKIDLQGAIDAYGNFLVKVGNSGLSGDAARKLHDEVLLISKVTATPQGKMDAAVYDVAKMLGEGVLEARSTRALERVMPQISTFLAKELGITRQEFSRMESSGKLTKSAIDSKVLLKAFEDYASTLGDKLPESLKTMQSELNDLDNKWLEFKNDIVLELKPELVDFFHEIENGIKWLKENEDGVIRWGKTIEHLAEIYIEYKGVMLLVNAAQSAYAFFTTGLAEKTTSETAALYSKSTAVNALAASYERLNIAQGLNTGSAILGATESDAAAAAIFAKGQSNAERIMSARETNLGAETAVSAGAIASESGFALTSASIMPVMVAYFGGQALAQMLPNNRFTGENWDLRKLAKANTPGSAESIALGISALAMLGYDPIGDMIERNAELKKHPLTKDIFGLEKARETAPSAGNRLGGLNKTHDKLTPNGHVTGLNDKITGQRVITYNINIKDIIGQKVDKQIIENGSDIDINGIMEEVSRGLQSIVNGIQENGE